jgi:hypothetical protein
MNDGMLWFDNDPSTSLPAKVVRAADYFRRKYGRDPRICLVHPSMFPDPSAMAEDQISLSKHSSDVQVSQVEFRSGNVSIRSNRLIRPGHFWIGSQDEL